jgi:hypothetical protein
MADTQEAPQATEVDINALDGSVLEAQEALLKMMEPEKETPETEEEQPTEEEESTEETQDESLEEDSEESEEDSEEGSENREEEGEELVYAVNVGGEEHEVTLDELMKGYSRQSDYTKKTQEVSEQRKEMEGYRNKVETEINKIQEERAQYVNAINHYVEGMTNSMQQFNTINWDELRQLDPIEYMTKKEEQRDFMDKIETAKKTQAEAMAKAEQEHKVQFAETVREEQGKLIEKLPAWGDQEKRQKIASELRDYAVKNDFSNDELDMLNDHRAFVVLYKAMEYDKQKTANPRAKKVRNKPRVVRAGSPQTKQSKNKSSRAKSMKRLQETGHVDDAAALLEDMFKS